MGVWDWVSGIGWVLSYQAFPIWNALRPKLNWTHYRLLLRVEDPHAREWYAKETEEQNRNTRHLERQIGTLYYERLLASKHCEEASHPLLSLAWRVNGWVSVMGWVLGAARERRRARRLPLHVALAPF